ncbi:hypothetical protein FACS189413_02900 [Bacteroidia bacterium]|nr:hypothetical protein FACS189413_02900 [Bacteroidia bacterium]
MKIKSLGIVLFLFLCPAIYADLDLRPTFESCGVYLPYANEIECRISYKKTSESTWKQAYTPVYDQGKKEFRVSLVRLSENTGYQVKAELYLGASKITEFTGNFKTWNSNVPVSKTEDISKYKKGNVYVIDKVKGTENGWIKITSSQVLQTDIENVNEDDIVVAVTNSQYVILDGLTVKGGRRHGIVIYTTCDNMRIVNCDISKWGRPVIGQTKGGQFLDKDGKEINHDAGIFLHRTLNVVVERCYIHDTKSRTNAWSGTVELGDYKGQKFSSSHPQGPNAIYLDQGKGGTVIRYNDLVGSQSHRYNDPVETADNSYWDGGFNRDADIYGNMIAFGQDDGIELDGGQCNIRTFNNRFEQTYCGISTAPNRQGPSYLFNNVVWNLGDSRNSTNVSVKNGGGDMVNAELGQYPGRNFFFNNTFIAPKNGITGVGYGDGTQREMFHATTRNNILISQTTPVNPNGNNGSGLCISDQHKTSGSDYDYDLLGNTSNANGAGSIWAREGSEAHGIFALPQFEDEAHGVLTLKSDNNAIDKGIGIANFSDQYQGAAPDMGAFERGASSLFPIRPLNISSDKYYMELTESNPSATITLNIGNIGSETAFSIRKDDEMTWLEVAVDKSKIQSNSTLTLTLSASATNGRQSGMMFFRLSNGLSVPVTVVAETAETQYPQREVTNENDSGAGSLRQVIAGAFENELIVIPANFTIRLNSEITLNKPLKINGQGATVQVANPGVSAHRVFAVGNTSKPANPETVSLENLTILGGDVSANETENSASYGGAVFVNTSLSIALKNCIVSNGKATYGGGLMASHPSTRSILIENCVFQNNSAITRCGACMLAGSGPIVVRNSSFLNNQTANEISAVASYGINTTISTCYFKGNSANPGNRNGAALVYGFDGNNGVMNVENTTFESNTNAYSDGGSAFYGNGSSSSSAILTNCTFYDNRSSHGAFYAYNGKFIVVHSTFSGNTGTSTQYGSAFYARDNAAVQFTLVNNIWAYNYGGAGAIYVGAKSVESGSHNLIESKAGKSVLNLQGSLPYNPNQDLFTSYTTINGRTVPVLDNATHTLPVTATGIAARAGCTNFSDIAIPTFDQRGVQRGNPPYLGAYEYTVDPVTEINEAIVNKHFIILNPVRENFYLNDNELINKINIFDISGKTVFSENCPAKIVPVNHLPNGCYIVGFETQKGMFYEKLIIEK